MPQLQAEAPRLAEYQAYIDFEMKIGDPARIQLIFERALVENCLVPDLWIRYSRYLVRYVLQFCVCQGRAFLRRWLGAACCPSLHCLLLSPPSLLLMLF